MKAVDAISVPKNAKIHPVNTSLDDAPININNRICDSTYNVINIKDIIRKILSDLKYCTPFNSRLFY